jgi:pilus assembly protein CpaF
LEIKRKSNWDASDEKNLLHRGQRDNISNQDEQEWKLRLIEANRADQEFLATTPGPSDMNLHLSQLAREIGVPEEFRDRLIENILEDIYDYGILSELKKNPKATTIWVYGDHSVEYAESGEIKLYNKHFASNEEVYQFAEKKLTGTTHRYARNIPEIDAILADGSRFHIMQGSAGISRIHEDGKSYTSRMPLLTIRQFAYPYKLSYLVKDAQMRTYLEWLPQLGEATVIAGNQGSGKTTHLNALTEFIPLDLHVITIEEAPEMQPLFRGIAVRLWNQGEISEFNFVNMIKNTRATLRMTGDVMMIGEIRDEDATWEYLRITNVGLHWTATTLHANSANDAVFRLVTLGMASITHPPRETVVDMISRGVSHVVYLKRKGKHMGIQEIAELTGVVNGEIQLRTVFEQNIETKEVKFHGLSDRIREKAKLVGLPVERMN